MSTIIELQKKIVCKMLMTHILAVGIHSVVYGKRRQLNLGTTV